MYLSSTYIYAYKFGGVTWLLLFVADDIANFALLIFYFTYINTINSNYSKSGHLL